MGQLLARRRGPLAAAAGILLVVAECSGSGASPATSAGSSAAEGGAASGAASPASTSGVVGGGDYGGGSAAASGGSAGAYQLAVANGSVGAYLTGEDGRTLYVYKKDPANATTSACTGQCATNWPPFELDTGETVTAASGVSGTIASITRSDDGKKQVTYNGAPLYYFAPDKKAGDVNGQGVGNVWFAAKP
jgi:predicted lipoprotein with Yx(FWY)xxD motif